jgi:NADH-quinone oxidoreductase subunit G
MHANIDVHEPKPPDDLDTPLSFSMEGTPVQPPSALIPFFWSPGWNSIQATNFYQSEIAGPLRGGDPGVRLIEPAPDATGKYFDRIPNVFARQSHKWLLVPLYHIFGSEELSFVSAGVAELAPKPYVALGAKDAAALGLRPGEAVQIQLDGAAYRLPIVINEELPAGVAGLPVGVPPLTGVQLPAYSGLLPDSEYPNAV